MTELEKDQLLADSDQIRDEVIPDANTETRVGTLFRNIVNFAYSAWLGITDETTHLLTPKEIREGEGAETKLITSSEADTKIATEVPTISPQFTIVGGQAFFATEFDTSTASNITFTRPRRYAGAFTEGEEKRVTKPSYSPVITISKENAKQRCKVELYHSGILVPSFLVDELDEDWGTKPEWLTVIGDAYLVGSDHMNLIKFTYYEFDKVGSDLYVDEVVCEVIAIANGNMDSVLGKLEPNTILKLKFNENESPVLIDSIINSSIYGESLQPQVINLGDPIYVAEYEDLGSGNYALITAKNSNNNNSITPNTDILLPLTGNLFSRLMVGEEFTMILRIKFLTNGAEVESSVGVLSNVLPETSGFYISRRSDARMEFGWSRVGTTTATYQTDVAKPINKNTGFWTIGVRGRRPASNQIQAIFHRISADNLVTYDEMGSTLSTNAANVGGSFVNDIELRFGKTNPASTASRPVSRDTQLLFNKWLDDSTFQNIMESVDNQTY
jgi:hypothetical protein